MMLSDGKGNFFWYYSFVAATSNAKCRFIIAIAALTAKDGFDLLRDSNALTSKHGSTDKLSTQI